MARALSAFVCAAGVPFAAHGAVVSFQNTCGFDWSPQIVWNEGVSNEGVGFDPTLPCDMQDGSGESRQSHANISGVPSCAGGYNAIALYGGFLIASDKATSRIRYSGGPTGCVQTSLIHPVAALAPGNVVGPNLAFEQAAHTFDKAQCNCAASIDRREHLFVGLQLLIEGRAHYGWIEMGWQTAGRPRHVPVRWAYETEPDTPIVIDGAPCPADMDGDGVVGSSDLASLLGQWGQTGPADLSVDGAVNAADIGFMLGSWGPCPE